MNPLKQEPRSLCGVKQKKYIVILIWIFGLLFSLPEFIFHIHNVEQFNKSNICECHCEQRLAKLYTIL